MKIYNFLPQFLEAMRKWEKKPTSDQFERDYLAHLGNWLDPILEDFGARMGGSLHAIVEGLNWKEYRAEALSLDPEREERRAQKHLTGVEKLLGVTLAGEVVLFGAFTAMDGYARFDNGTHRVYLGVDESHGRGEYLDVLISHELTHVARESLESTWAGFGLSNKMTHDEFVENQPVVEHLMSEGFSCVISEILNPNEKPWNFCYQTQDSLTQILEHGPAVDKVVHAELKNKKGSYFTLYDVRRYKPELPRYAHYVWAWQWAKHVLKTKAGGDPKRLLRMCSSELIDDALAFKLQTIL